MAKENTVSIIRPKQLLVEGRDAEAFFWPFVENLGLEQEIQIQNYGGVSEFTRFMSAFVRASDFKKVPVVSIGIVRDAENDGQAAFQSICSGLKQAQMPIPGAPLAATNSTPKISVYILPDGSAEPGMIETLLLRAVEGDPIFECVDQYLLCVMERARPEPSPRDKARLLTFLASRPKPIPLIGYAARAGYLNFDSEVYRPLKEFVLSI